MSTVKELLDETKTVKELLDETKNLLSQQEKFAKQLKELDDKIEENSDIYKEAMTKREKEATEFCIDKTSDQLKEFLADQYVPYNSWKNADHSELVKLVLECYDQ
jgi:ElaB/YqjD/DUF883 family membrane-anchored ribosome-binding protein